ncbi:hypothetical protein [Gordonia jacobaea]|uniref:hypothetical protein n=1 Tax=Gordonia jacobaea TaxID=122202 RepID=UPI003D71750E
MPDAAPAPAPSQPADPASAVIDAQVESLRNTQGRLRITFRAGRFQIPDRAGHWHTVPEPLIEAMLADTAATLDLDVDDPEMLLRRFAYHLGDLDPTDGPIVNARFACLPADHPNGAPRSWEQRSDDGTLPEPVNARALAEIFIRERLYRTDIHNPGRIVVFSGRLLLWHDNPSEYRGPYTGTWLGNWQPIEGIEDWLADQLRRWLAGARYRRPATDATLILTHNGLDWSSYDVIDWPGSHQKPFLDGTLVPAVRDILWSPGLPENPGELAAADREKAIARIQHSEVASHKPRLR